MKAIIGLFITVALAALASAQINRMSPVLTSYYKLKDALVNNDPLKAATLAGQLVTAINQTETSGLKAGEKKVFEKQRETMLKAASTISKSKDLEKQREAFATLSVVLWKVIISGEKLSATVYYQFCPMKGAYWLSGDSVIRNPYYGSGMLTCGSIADKK